MITSRLLKHIIDCMEKVKWLERKLDTNLLINPGILVFKNYKNLYEHEIHDNLIDA